MKGSTRGRGVTLYQGVYEALRRDIVEGIYASGAALPPERKLSAMFGVCHLTVRKALARLVEERMIMRRSGSGTVVTYNSTDPQLRIPELHEVAVVLEEVDDFTSRIITRLEAECRKRNTRLSLFCHGRDPHNQLHQYRRAGEKKDCFVVILPSSPLPQQFSDPAILARTVIVDDCIPDIQAPQILSDDEEGMFQAVRYLSDLGHRKIGHISADTKTTGMNRRKGFNRAVTSLNLVDDSGLIENGSFLLESSYFATEKVFDRHPDITALVCANDYAAFGAMKSLKKRGLTPGTNFSLIGYGNYDISEPLGLTSVDQCTGALCDQVLFFIDEYARGVPLKGEVRLIPAELKIRNSCVKVR